jgi:hypothetical protein
VQKQATMMLKSYQNKNKSTLKKAILRASACVTPTDQLPQTPKKPLPELRNIKRDMTVNLSLP